MEASEAGVLAASVETHGPEFLPFIEQRLYTAVLSDALDELGTRHQVMREYLRPVHSGCRFAGWARTITCIDCTEIPFPPYQREIEAVDGILPDEVVVVSTGHSSSNAPWGELLSTAARARGARGAVVDGLVRDVRKIEALGFPVFATGIKPVDSMGRGVVTTINEPAECGEVMVHPGDLIVADYDGVLVIPEAMAGEVVRLAADKARREDASRAELARGAYLEDVYRKFGVL
jgi:4-hydroxy-4-methyl-2-oxoglutarate aldolase